MRQSEEETRIYYDRMVDSIDSIDFRAILYFLIVVSKHQQLRVTVASSCYVLIQILLSALVAYSV